MRVDADFAIQFSERSFRDGTDFVRQATAVRVAQHDKIRARFFRRLPRRKRVIGIQFETVERMLGVVDDEFAVVFQETHGVADHREIFFRRASQNFLHVQHRGLAVNRHDGRAGFDEQTHLIVLFDRRIFFARRAERGELRIFEFALFGLREKFDVLGIAARPAAFNVMHPERIELLGDAEFVRDREIDAFALRTVAQGRVIDFDLGFHKCRKNGRAVSLNFARRANRKTEINGR